MARYLGWMFVLSGCMGIIEAPPFQSATGSPDAFTVVDNVPDLDEQSDGAAPIIDFDDSPPPPIPTPVDGSSPPLPSQADMARSSPPSPLVCPALSQRISVTTVGSRMDVAARFHIAHPSGGSLLLGGGAATNDPNQPGQARIWRTGTDDKLIGQPIVFSPVHDLYDAVAHPDGVALLYRRLLPSDPVGTKWVYNVTPAQPRTGSVRIARLSATGAVIFDNAVLAATNHERIPQGGMPGDQWGVGNDGGRLAWSGSEYAVRFPHHQNHGAGGVHQGGLNRICRTDGTCEDIAYSQSRGGVEWHCSHTKGDRVAHNGTRYAFLCLSDSDGGGFEYGFNVFYPEGPICRWRDVDNDGDLDRECSPNSGAFNAGVGDLLPTVSGFLFTFSTAKRDPSRTIREIALVRLLNDGTAAPPTFLTQAANANAHSPTLARAGKRFIVTYVIDGQSGMQVIEVDQNGTILDGPVAWPQRTYSVASQVNGDATWLQENQNAFTTELVRVRGCN